MTKDEKVLKHFEENKTLTSMDAFLLFKTLKLADIVFRLKKKGHRFEDPLERVINLDTGTNYGNYRYLGKDELFIYKNRY